MTHAGRVIDSVETCDNVGRTAEFAKIAEKSITPRSLRGRDRFDPK
jgi:hypothetical protein